MPKRNQKYRPGIDDPADVFPVARRCDRSDRRHFFFSGPYKARQISLTQVEHRKRDKVATDRVDKSRLKRLKVDCLRRLSLVYVPA
jgi:hypothetical protein